MCKEANYNVKLTLTTVCGHVGVGWIRADARAHRSPDMVWSGDGLGETATAQFDLYDGACIVDTTNITGDEWRQIESNEEDCYVLIWCRRGVKLLHAVAAAIDACDPPGRDHDYETALEEKDARIARLEAEMRKQRPALIAVFDRELWNTLA